MSVLLEAYTVIVRRDALESSFEGGWTAYLQFTMNRSACSDGTLVAVGFTSLADAQTYKQFLTHGGLGAGDLADWSAGSGLSSPSDWLTVATVEEDGGEVQIAHLASAEAGDVAKPSGWTYKHSISEGAAHGTFGEDGYRLRFLKAEDYGDFYLEQIVGEEILFSSEIPGGFAVSPLTAQLRDLCQQVLAMADQRAAFPADDQEKIQFWKGRMESNFVTQIDEILADEGQGDGFAYYTKGLIHRVLENYGEAAEALFQAHDIHPGAQNILRELVAVLQGLGKNQEALSYAREAVSVIPSNLRAWNNLASCLMRCYEEEESKRVIEFALEMDPSDEVNLAMRDSFNSYFAEAE